MRKITWKSVFAMILSVSILMGLSVPIMAEDKIDIGTPQDVYKRQLYGRRLAVL